MILSSNLSSLNNGSLQNILNDQSYDHKNIRLIKKIDNDIDISSDRRTNSIIITGTPPIKILPISFWANVLQYQKF